MRTILTERLRLEPVTPANADVLWRVLQEPDLRDYQDLPDIDRGQFARAVSERPARLEPGATGRFEWLVRLAGDGDSALGWLSLRIADRTRSTAEIGYSIVREHRGAGYATEAVGALIADGFNIAQLARIRAYCVPGNVSSRAVLHRIGFEDDGILPHGATVQGQPVDVIAFSLERERWKKALKAAPPAIRS
jgi:RimJ/RimL family protein N-acetyltransferase